MARRCSSPHALVRRPRITGLAAVLLLGATRADTAGGQMRAEADIGAARVTQSEFSAVQALTAQGTAVFDRGPLSVQGAGALTRPTSGSLRVQGQLGGAVRIPLRGRFGAELGAWGSVYDEDVYPRSVAGSVAGRVTAGFSRARAWAGAGAGALDDGVFRYPVRTVDAGVTTGWRSALVTAAAAWNGTEGSPRMEFIGTTDPIVVEVRDRITYTDASLSAEGQRGRAEWRAQAGARLIHETVAYTDKPTRMFGQAAAAWWMTPRFAVAGSVGRELPDLARGLPDTRYLSLSLRARLQRPAAGAKTLRPRVARGAAPDVLLERGLESGAKLRVLAGAAAQRVEVAGTFTEWQPVALSSDGSGAWVLGAVLPSGPHRLMVRVDGGAWQAPSNLPALDDELGGRVGIVTVP